MTALDRKINQLAARHGWSIEKQHRAAVDCYIIDAATYEDAGKITAGARVYALKRCRRSTMNRGPSKFATLDSGTHGGSGSGKSPPLLMCSITH